MFKRIRSQRGQTIIEFALIAALLFALIFSIIEFSIILYDKAVITYAVWEGARQSSVFRVNADGTPDPFSTAEIQAIVGGYLQNWLVTFGTPFDTSMVNANFTGTPPSAGGTTGAVTVTVTFPYTPLVVPSLIFLSSSTVNLSSTSVMQTE